MRILQLFPLLLAAITLFVERTVKTADEKNELPPIRYIGYPTEIYLA